MLLIGITIFAYPLISQFYNDRVMYSTVSDYSDNVKSYNNEELKKNIEAAQKFNDKLRQGNISIVDPFSDDVTANLNKYAEEDYPSYFQKGGVIGTINIPKINQKLAIYNGVNDHVLSNGVGYMSNTSIPIGGLGTHTVLTGHRGLPTKEFFRYLDRLQIGDVFYVECLGQKLAYEVDQVLVVEPSDTSSLKIESDKAYCTLITCEPYMINSHRMLVRGHQIPYEEAAAMQYKSTSDNMTFFKKHVLEISAIGILLAFTVLLVLLQRISARGKKNKKGVVKHGAHFK